jgi:peroxiredoxin Q/BCP
MLGVGDTLPDATVFAGPREPVALRRLLDDGPLLLLFYLFDWSATCTNELQLLRDRGREFEQAGVHRYGISRDSPWTHIAWQQVIELDYPLLSDWNGEATEGFGIAHTYRGMRGVSERSAFLIDAGGTVRGAWRYGSSALPDVEELLSAARALSG